MRWMSTNKQKLNPNKAVILLLGSDPDPGKVLPAHDDDVLLKRQVCNLGVILDPTQLLELQLSQNYLLPSQGDN